MTKTTTVWRVENESGNGPLRRYEESTLVAVNADLEPVIRRLPQPHEDRELAAQFSGAVMDTRKLCAFESLEQYHLCFNTNELKQALHYAGFHLVQYEVEATAVWHGETQSVFYPDKAKRIAVMPCSDPAVPMSDEIAERLAYAKKQISRVKAATIVV